MADIKAINFLENTTPALTRNIHVTNEANGEWERLELQEFFDEFGFVSGGYFPTLTTDGNDNGSVVIGEATFMRMRNEVSVKMVIRLDISVSDTETNLGISLPVASDIQSNQQLVGVFSAHGIKNTASTTIINGDNANDRASFTFTTESGITVSNASIIFQYKVI